MTTTFTSGAPPGNEEAPAATEALQNNTDDDNDQQANRNTGGMPEAPLGDAMNVADYIELLGISDDEMIGMLWIRGDHKQTAVMPANSVQAVAEHQIPREFNAYLAPNPTSGSARLNKGRGTEEQLARLAAIFADLDVKPGACRDIDHAWQIINTISERIEERPTVVIFSGGGLQPIWVMEDCSPAGFEPAAFCSGGSSVAVTGVLRGLSGWHCQGPNPIVTCGDSSMSVYTSTLPPDGVWLVSSKRLVTSS